MRRGFIIIPFIDLWEKFTQAALYDCYDQKDIESQVLLIDNGSGPEDRRKAYLQVVLDKRTLLWQHSPCLPSLAATWNAALDFVWDAGGEEALVLNNDTRIHPWTYGLLNRVLRGFLHGFQDHKWGENPALFVTGVGVRELQWQELANQYQFNLESRGGPDFSCFMLSKECHSKYRFDENFLGAYFEDNDYHYRMQVGGDGSRIFGVNIPYLHFASQTVNRSPEIAAAFAKKFERNRDYYRLKWGGDPGSEAFKVPFDGKG